MEKNNQEVHHRNGDKYESQMRSHKQFVEKDFAIAVSKFRIGVLEQRIAIRNSLDILQMHSQDLARIQKELSAGNTGKQKDTLILDRVGNMLEMSREEIEDNYPSQRDVE